MYLSIIIVNYNTKKLLANCLDSIEKSGDELDKEVIVVDNASDDGSYEMLKSKYKKVKRVRNSKNLGFAGANNVGVKAASGKYVWLLNSDTVLKADTLELLMDEVRRNDSKVATCRLLNEDGSDQPQGGYLPKLRNIAAWMLFIDDLPIIGRLIKPYQQRRVGYFRSNQNPGWVSGTALLVERELYEKMGGLDENLFMYGEDVEFCIRIKDRGMRIDYFTRPRLVHIGQASGSSGQAILGEFKGLVYIFGKHKSKWELPILKLLLWLGAGLRWLIWGVVLGDRVKKEAYGQVFRVV